VLGLVGAEPDFFVELIVGMQFSYTYGMMASTRYLCGASGSSPSKTNLTSLSRFFSSSRSAAAPEILRFLSFFFRACSFDCSTDTSDVVCVDSGAVSGGLSTACATENI